MTAYSDDPRWRDAIILGAKGTIHKPFSNRQFLDWLHMSVSEPIQKQIESKLRISVNQPIRLKKDTFWDWKWYGAQAINLSVRGALIRALDLGIEVNDAVVLEFPWIHDGSGAPLRVGGVAKWQRITEDPPNHIEYGIDLAKMSQQSAKIYRNAVQQTIKAARSKDRATNS